MWWLIINLHKGCLLKDIAPRAENNKHGSRTRILGCSLQGLHGQTIMSSARNRTRRGHQCVSQSTAAFGVNRCAISDAANAHSPYCHSVSGSRKPIASVSTLCRKYRDDIVIIGRILGSGSCTSWQDRERCRILLCEQKLAPNI